VVHFAPAIYTWMARFHDRMPVILNWSDAGAWMIGQATGELLRAPADDALQEWIVAPRVNRSGVGDDDSRLIEAVQPA
jgi:putative SOS response-associated peptidase YedK